MPTWLRRSTPLGGFRCFAFSRPCWRCWRWRRLRPHSPRPSTAPSKARSVDDQSAVLPGVTVTVANTGTGDSRVVVTNDSGLFRALLLPLGTYRVSAELQGFRTYEQTGIILTRRPDRGHQHQDDGRRAAGDDHRHRRFADRRSRPDRTRPHITEAEIKTLPLTSRNPYNFALLQPGVVGFENQEFGVPRITANGALVRVNYQIDGSNNTQKDRAGLRQMPMSEVMIREVKVVTTGYAPEFGQTMGMIYNAITPSGTNMLKGQASYRLQRKPFAAFPFFTQGPHTSDRKPPTDVNIFTFDLGGPIRPRQDALLRWLRAHRARSLRHRGDHDHAGQPGGARPERAALHAARAQHRICHRQSRSPVERHQPSVGALHLLRQLHQQQHRRRHQLGRARHRLQRSAAFDGGAADFDPDADAAQRAARSVRDARAGSRARLGGRDAGRRSRSPTSPTSAARSPATPTRVLRSPRTCCRSTTT